MKARFVSENVRFERGKKPHVAMDVGIRKNIQEWMSWVYGNFSMEEGRDYVINPDYTIDTLLNFEVPDMKIVEFPDYINFRTARLDFMVDYCGLKSLRGCPKRVMGYFSCESNELTTLDYFPEKIQGNIFVRDNPGHFIFDQVLATIGTLKKYQKIYAEDSHVDESIKFERGRDPKEVLGLGIYGIVDAEVKKLGLDHCGTIPIAAGDYGGDIGKVHQWRDKYGANELVLTDRDGEELEMDGTNSEEDYFRIIGKEEIIEYIESGKLRKFIRLD